MVDLQGSDVLRADEAVVASMHDGGLVLMHTGRGHVFSANRTGAHIWRCIERRLPVAAIARELSEAYALPFDAAEAHTRRFVGVLNAQGLVVLDGGR